MLNRIQIILFFSFSLTLSEFFPWLSCRLLVMRLASTAINHIRFRIKLIKLHLFWFSHAIHVESLVNRFDFPWFLPTWLQFVQCAHTAQWFGSLIRSHNTPENEILQVNIVMSSLGDLNCELKTISNLSLFLSFSFFQFYC